MITILGSGGHGFRSLSEFLDLDLEFEFFVLTVDWGQVNFGGFNGTWGRILEWENEQNNKILHLLPDFLMPILPCGDLNKILMYFWQKTVGEAAQNLDIRSDNLETLQNLWQELKLELGRAKNPSEFEKNLEKENLKLPKKDLEKEVLERGLGEDCSQNDQENKSKNLLRENIEKNSLERSKNKNLELNLELRDKNLELKTKKSTKLQINKCFDPSLFLEFENYLPKAFEIYLEGKKTLNLQARGPSLGYFWHTFLFWQSWKKVLENPKNFTENLASSLRKDSNLAANSKNSKSSKIQTSEINPKNISFCQDKKANSQNTSQKLSQASPNFSSDQLKPILNQKIENQNQLETNPNLEQITQKNSEQNLKNIPKELQQELENEVNLNLKNQETDTNFGQVMVTFNHFYHQSGILPERIWLDWTNFEREILVGSDGQIAIVGEEILDEWEKPILPESLEIRTKKLEKTRICHGFLQKLKKSDWVIIPTGSVANWLPLVNNPEICQVLKTKNAQNKLIWVQNCEKNTQEFAMEIYQKYLQNLGLCPIMIETKNLSKVEIPKTVSQKLQETIKKNFQKLKS